MSDATNTAEANGFETVHVLTAGVDFRQRECTNAGESGANKAWATL